MMILAKVGLNGEPIETPSICLQRSPLTKIEFWYTRQVGVFS